MLFSPDATVLLAGGVQTLAFLFVNQIWLRVTALIGTGLYILYYMIAADTPLWAAVAVSVAMVIANVIGLFGLWLRSSRLVIPARFRALYPLFSSISPGDFRKLMSVVEWQVLDSPQIITHEGEHLNELFFILSSGAKIEKMGQTFALPGAVFVGEVAYLTGRPPSATTHLPEGCAFLRWNAADLRRLSAKRGTLKLAIEAMISNDLAAKVAASVAPTTKQEARPSAAIAGGDPVAL